MTRDTTFKVLVFGALLFLLTRKRVPSVTIGPIGTIRCPDGSAWIEGVGCL